MMNSKPEFEIFNMKFAGYLMQLGFVLLSMRPNRDGSGKNVFIFRDTPDLRKAIDAYMSK